MTTTRPSADELAAAVGRMRHLHDDLGVRTDFSFQAPGTPGDEGKARAQAAAVALERRRATRSASASSPARSPTAAPARCRR